MNGHGNGRGGYAGAYTGRGGRGSGGRGSRSRAGRGGGSGAWSVGPPSTDTIHVDLTSTGAQLSPVPDEPVGATEPFKPPTRLDIRKASVFDFVPSSPNSARAKRSPKSSSYATRYDNRINSPGSLMSPKSEAGALVGAPARDESTDEAKWRMRVEPRVVRSLTHNTRRLPTIFSDTQTHACVRCNWLSHTQGAAYRWSLWTGCSLRCERPRAALHTRRRRRRATTRSPVVWVKTSF